MLTLIIKSIILSAGSWVFYYVLSRYLVKTSLDNTPGLPSPSFFTGNFFQLFDANGWDFHRDIAAKYEGIIRVEALFGVDGFQEVELFTKNLDHSFQHFSD
ncbi:hypothetical protein K443DRAFT_8617 [Laccaria amethystina LaAM-08-1]|uniref:Cytochrome P450 n=1 Tax=Laccaria amethystina LaAM-08-1 TaxID=1095629 RepID=A0A0C9XNQ8_9AGAR|nr:hypothetical protein K443DRAFT_8617 [Laccaria amethystina LaAM-08-1]